MMVTANLSNTEFVEMMAIQNEISTMIMIMDKVPLMFMIGEAQVGPLNPEKQDEQKVT